MIKTKNRSTHRSSEEATQNNFTLTSTMNASLSSSINKTVPTSVNKHMTRSYDNYSNNNNNNINNNMRNLNMEKNSLPVTPMASAAITNVARHVEEDYNKMLDTVSMPNYKTIKTLLSSSYNTGDSYDKHNDGTPSEIIPGIQVSFELFETVQNRFALTRQNLERTKAELLNRNSQYNALQAQLQTLTNEFEVLSKRNKNLECAHTDLQQVVAKQEVMLEVLRKENSTVKSDALLFQERLLNKEEENQILQNKITEGMVMIAQKDAAINTLRRELGRFGRFTTHQRNRHRVRRDGSHTTAAASKGEHNKVEGDKNEEELDEQEEFFYSDDEDDANHVYTAEALEGIAAEVEERSLEARMKMKIADLERTVNSLEKEKQLICDQHTNYRSYVEGVMEAATSECLTLQDEMRRHVCVNTPYLLSSTFFSKLHALEPIKKNDMSSDVLTTNTTATPPTVINTYSGDGINSDSVEGNRKSHIHHNFDALTTFIGSLLERTKNIDIDSSSILYTGLNDNVMAYSKVMNVCEELSSLFRTFEDQLLTQSNSIYEMKEEWNKAHIHLFIARAKDELNLSITQLHKSLIELLKRENEYRDSLKSSPNTTPPLRGADEHTITTQSTTTAKATNDLESGNNTNNNNNNNTRDGVASLLKPEEPHSSSSSLAALPLLSGKQKHEDVNNNNVVIARKDANNNDGGGIAESAMDVNYSTIESGTQTDVSYDMSDTLYSANRKNELRTNAMYFVDGKLIDDERKTIELCDQCSSVLVHHSRQSPEYDTALQREQSSNVTDKLNEELRGKERPLSQLQFNSGRIKAQPNEESSSLVSLHDDGEAYYRLHIELDDTFNHLLLAMCPCCEHKWDIFSCECADNTKLYAAKLHNSYSRTPRQSANNDKHSVHDRTNKVHGISSTENNSDADEFTADDVNHIPSMANVPGEAAVGAKSEGWKESTLPYVMKHEMTYATTNESISEATENESYNVGAAATTATSDNMNRNENDDHKATSSPSHSASSTRRKKTKSKKQLGQKNRNLSTSQTPLSSSTLSSLSVSKKMLSSGSSNTHNRLKMTSAQDNEHKDHHHHKEHHYSHHRVTPENAAESSSSCLSMLSSASALSASLSTPVTNKKQLSSSSSLAKRNNHDDGTSTVDQQHIQYGTVASSSVNNEAQTNDYTAQTSMTLLEQSANANVSKIADYENNKELPLTENSLRLQSTELNGAIRSGNNPNRSEIQRPLPTSSYGNESTTMAAAVNKGINDDHINKSNIIIIDNRNTTSEANANESMPMSETEMQNKNLMEQLQMLQSLLQCKEQELAELQHTNTKTRTPHEITGKDTMSVAVQTSDLDSAASVLFNWNDLTSNSDTNTIAQNNDNIAFIDNKTSSAHVSPLSELASKETVHNTLHFADNNKSNIEKQSNTFTVKTQIGTPEPGSAQGVTSKLIKAENDAKRVSGQTMMGVNVNIKENASTLFNNANNQFDKLTQGDKDKKEEVRKQKIKEKLEGKLPNVHNKLIGAKESVNYNKPQVNASYARTARSVKRPTMPLPLSSRTVQSSPEYVRDDNQSPSVQLPPQQNKWTKSPFKKLFNETHVPLHVHAIQLNQLLNAQLPNLDYRLPSANSRASTVPNAISASFYPRLAPLNQQSTTVNALYDREYGVPRSSSSYQLREGEAEAQSDGAQSKEYTSASNKLNLPFTEYKLSNSTMKELAELEELRAKERNAQFTNTYDAQKMKWYNKWHEQQMIAKHIASQRVIRKAHTLPPYARNINSMYGATNRSALSVQSYKDYQDTHNNYNRQQLQTSTHLPSSHTSESSYTEIQRAIIAKMQEHSNEHHMNDIIPYDDSSLQEMYSLTRPIPSMRKWSNTSSNSTSLKSLQMENVNHAQDKYNTNNRYLYYKVLQPAPSIVAPLSRQAYFTRNGRWHRGLAWYPQSNSLTLLASCTSSEMYSTPPLTISELLTLQRWKQQQKKRRLTLLKAKRDPYYIPGKNTNTINYVRRVQLMKKQHKWYNKQQQQQQQNLQANQMLIGKRLNAKSESSTTL